MGFVALGYVLLYVAGSIRVIWLPVAFGAGIVFLLEPFVRLLERRMPRPVAVVLALLAMIGLVIALGALVFPTIRAQAADFGQRLPDLYLAGINWVREVGASIGLDVDELLSQEAIEAWLNDPANQETVQNLLLGFGAGAGQVIRGFAEAVAVLGLAPVLALYLLIDLENFKANTLGMTPPRHREEFAFVSGEVGTALSSFVRGQLLVAVIVGVASSLGMWLIDLPFWLLIGIIAGFLNLIPFMGPVVGGALAVLVALLNGSVTQAIWAVLIMIAIQQVDNHVITPLVQRTRVNLSPLVIVLALDHRWHRGRASRGAGCCSGDCRDQDHRGPHVADSGAGRNLGRGQPAHDRIHRSAGADRGDTAPSAQPEPAVRHPRASVARRRRAANPRSVGSDVA